MTFVGRLHPVLIHFPIALVIAANAFEAAFGVTRHERFRTVAVSNVRAASAFACAAAVAGWLLARSPQIESTPVLEWHRWLGTLGACLTVAAAVLSYTEAVHSKRVLQLYRVALVGAGIVISVSGHLGASLVWGADFLRP